MPMPPPKKMPTDPRMEVAQEIKQHCLGLAMTHRKMTEQMKQEAGPKKKPKKPAEEMPEDEMGGGGDPGDHEYR